MKRSNKRAVLAAAAFVALGGSGWAQVGSGPVAKNCAAEIDKLCQGLKHGRGEVRACLEGKRAELSAKCKDALDTTGGGRRR